jgi:chromosome segregation ATPase
VDKPPEPTLTILTTIISRQQAYRERREQQVETLRDRIAAAEEQCENQARQINSLQQDLTKLRDEREELLRELRGTTSKPSGTVTSTITASSPKPESTKAVDDDEDDLLAYSALRRFSQ